MVCYTDRNAPETDNFLLVMIVIPNRKVSCFTDSVLSFVKGQHQFLQRGAYFSSFWGKETSLHCSIRKCLHYLAAVRKLLVVGLHECMAVANKPSSEQFLSGAFSYI
uniref:Secreted protein n=1 Tax=Ascaris lumbricoides TaxID=6252 RepID=A0A0M3ICB0_ASCLU